MASSSGTANFRDPGVSGRLVDELEVGPKDGQQLLPDRLDAGWVAGGVRGIDPGDGALRRGGDGRSVSPLPPRPVAQALQRFRREFEAVGVDLIRTSQGPSGFLILWEVSRYW